MTIGQETCERLRARGFRVEIIEGRLAVSQSSKLTDDDRGLIREHRDEVMALVRGTPLACKLKLVFDPPHSGETGASGRNDWRARPRQVWGSRRPGISAGERPCERPPQLPSQPQTTWRCGAGPEPSDMDEQIDILAHEHAKRREGFHLSQREITRVSGLLRPAT